MNNFLLPPSSPERNTLAHRHNPFMLTDSGTAPRRRVPAALAPTVRSRHVKRIEAVLDYIERHLSEDLSLEVLAERAAISPFHFHRLFQAWCGETLSRFVRRRRLETAAGRLRHCPAEKVTLISLNCGFASPESFARAFREHFGMTPSQWRAGGWSSWRSTGADPQSSPVSRVDVKRHEAGEYLFMRARGDYATTCAELWDRFLPWVHGMGLGGQPLVLIGLDDPAITDPTLCRMDACVQLPPGWRDPGTPLPRHRFESRWIATLRYDGPSSAVGRGWRELLDEWLPHAPFEMGEGHFFQRYDPHEGPPDSQLLRCELCMPVRPRTS